MAIWKCLARKFQGLRVHHVMYINSPKMFTENSKQRKRNLEKLGEVIDVGEGRIWQKIGKRKIAKFTVKVWIARAKCGKCENCHLEKKYII